MTSQSLDADETNMTTHTPNVRTTPYRHSAPAAIQPTPKPIPRSQNC